MILDNIEATSFTGKALAPVELQKRVVFPSRDIRDLVWFAFVHHPRSAINLCSENKMGGNAILTWQLLFVALQSLSMHGPGICRKRYIHGSVFRL